MWSGQQFTTSFWTNTPGIANGYLAAQVGCTNSGDLVAFSTSIAARGTNPNSDPQDCACFVFGSPSFATTVNVVVPAQGGWFQSDGETVDPTDPSAAAVIAGMLASGLCLPNGTAVTGYVRGYRVHVHPTPWPS